ADLELAGVLRLSGVVEHGERVRRDEPEGGRTGLQRPDLIHVGGLQRGRAEDLLRPERVCGPRHHLLGGAARVLEARVEVLVEERAVALREDEARETLDRERILLAPREHDGKLSYALRLDRFRLLGQLLERSRRSRQTRALQMIGV